MSITLAFIKKEFLQIIRDPSSLIIAFVLPTLLLFIYAYGINLDFANVRLGIKTTTAARQPRNWPAPSDKTVYYRRTLRRQKTNAGRPYPRKIQGALTIPSDFTRRLAAGKDASCSLLPTAPTSIR